MSSKASPQNGLSTSRSASKISNHAKPVTTDPSRKIISSSSSFATSISSTTANANENTSSSASSASKKKALMKTVGSENSLSPKVIIPDKRPSVRAVVSNIEKKAPVTSRMGHTTHEDLVKTKEKLVLSEKSNLDLKKEVSEYKKQMETLASELHNAIEGSKRDRFHVEEMEKATQAVARICQAELDAMKKQYVLDLQKYKDEMAELRQELHICVEARNEAVRLASDAMAAAECTVEKRVEEELRAEVLISKNVSTLESGSLVNLYTGEKLETPLVEECEVNGDESNPISEHDFEDGLMDGSAHYTTRTHESKNTSASISCVEETSVFALESSLKEEENKNLVDLHGIRDAESKHTPEITYDTAQDLDTPLNEATVVSESEVVDLRTKIQDLLTDLLVTKEAEEKCRLKIAEQDLEVDYLHSELLNAKKSNIDLVSQVSGMKAAIDRLRTELREVKETESNGATKNNVYTESQRFASSPIDVFKLEEAAQENLAKFIVEESVLLLFLQSLVDELGRKEEHICALMEKEADEGKKLQALNLKMARITEEKNRELMLLSKTLASINAEKDNLEKELANKTSELAISLGKETKAIQRAADLKKELECVQIEVAEMRKNESTLSERCIALSRQIECTNTDLLDMRQREESMVSIVSKFEESFEVKKMEELELRKAVSSSNKRCFALSAELDRSQSEVLKLRNRESDSYIKLAALCVILTNMSERNEKRFHDLVRDSQAKSLELDGEVIRLKTEVEKALHSVAQARNETDTLTEKLGVMKAEKEEIKRKLEDSLQEKEAAWEEIQLVRNKLIEFETKCDIVEYQAMQQELEMLRLEMTQLKKEKEIAEIACKTAEDRLDMQLESIKQHRESSVKMMDCIVTNENELNEIKTRLKNAEAELEESKIDAQRARMELDHRRLEQEAKEREILDLQQNLANAEKAKLDLEDEIQRLLDKSKRFQVNELGSIDIPIHLEGANGYSIPERREEKPEADNAQVTKVLKQSSSSLCEVIRRVDSGLGDDMEVGLREQLSCFSLRRDATFQDELVSLRTEDGEKKKQKKKKRGLLTRLGSLLEKKKA